MKDVWAVWVEPRPWEPNEPWRVMVRLAEAHHAHLVETYHPLVRRVAGKMWRALPSHVELDDIVQYGSLGLLKAVEKYDPARGVNFETVAVAFIRGCVLDELRSQDWAPRSLRRKQREIDNATKAYLEETGHAPTRAEVATRLGLTESEVAGTIRATEVAKTQSLDEGSGDEEGSRYESVEDHNAPDPERARESSHIYAVVTDLIRDFTLQDQLVLSLYYYEALTLAEVGRVLGIPESRASQIHTRSMVSIRERLLSLLTPE